MLPGRKGGAGAAFVGKPRETAGHKAMGAKVHKGGTSRSCCTMPARPQEAGKPPETVRRKAMGAKAKTGKTPADAMPARLPDLFASDPPELALKCRG